MDKRWYQQWTERESGGATYDWSKFSDHAIHAMLAIFGPEGGDPDVWLPPQMPNPKVQLEAFEQWADAHIVVALISPEHAETAGETAPDLVEDIPVARDSWTRLPDNDDTTGPFPIREHVSTFWRPEGLPHSIG